MTNFQKLYCNLFNEIEDLINANQPITKTELIQLQLNAENHYIDLYDNGINSNELDNEEY